MPKVYGTVSWYGYITNPHVRMYTINYTSGSSVRTIYSSSPLYNHYENITLKIILKNQCIMLIERTKDQLITRTKFLKNKYPQIPVWRTKNVWFPVWFQWCGRVIRFFTVIFSVIFSYGEWNCIPVLFLNGLCFILSKSNWAVKEIP